MWLKEQVRNVEMNFWSQVCWSWLPASGKEGLLTLRIVCVELHGIWMTFMGFVGMLRGHVLCFFKKNLVSGKAADFRVVPAPKTEGSAAGNQSVPVWSH